jgi:16S rRNA (cytidine1402-2'-O)-methyltransferase
VTLVVAGSTDEIAPPSTEVLAAAVRRRTDEGMTRRDAVDAVAAEHGISRRVVYAAATSV